MFCVPVPLILRGAHSLRRLKSDHVHPAEAASAPTKWMSRASVDDCSNNPPILYLHRLTIPRLNEAC